MLIWMSQSDHISRVAVRAHKLHPLSLPISVYGPNPFRACRTSFNLVDHNKEWRLFCGCEPSSMFYYIIKQIMIILYCH